MYRQYLGVMETARGAHSPSSRQKWNREQLKLGQQNQF